MALISVVIPVYNRERYLGEAVESVLCQSYKPIEIIVVDDGSTDGCPEVLKDFAADVRYVSQPHGGAGVARNRGVALSQGSFISFLDSDDIWGKDKLLLQMNAIDKDSGLDMVFGHIQQFHSPELDEETKAKIYCPSGKMPGYVAGTMLIRRESFEKVGSFAVEWKTGEFIDWYSRAVERGLKSVMLPEVVMRRRLHTTNMGVSERDARIDYVRILKASLNRRREVI